MSGSTFSSRGDAGRSTQLNLCSVYCSGPDRAGQNMKVSYDGVDIFLCWCKTWALNLRLVLSYIRSCEGLQVRTLFAGCVCKSAHWNSERSNINLKPKYALKCCYSSTNISWWHVLSMSYWQTALCIQTIDKKTNDSTNRKWVSSKSGKLIAKVKAPVFLQVKATSQSSTSDKTHENSCPVILHSFTTRTLTLRTLAPQVNYDKHHAIARQHADIFKKQCDPALSNNPTVGHILKE